MNDDKTDILDIPPLRQSAFRILVRVAIIFVGVYLVHQLMSWVMTSAESPSNRALMGSLLALTLLAYVALIAVPFVPGIEIGLSLMILRGAEVVPFVYLATVAGLLLAFFAGRFLPYDWLHRFFLDLRLKPACTLLATLKPLSRERRLAWLRRQLPGRLGGILVTSRHAALALLINLPGNALIGGGGGICLIAGLSRLYSGKAAVVTILLAVAPIPLVVWIFGVNALSFGP